MSSQQFDSADAARYHEAITRLLELKSNEVVGNSRPENATSLITEFFRHARERVVLYLPKVPASVFDNEKLRYHMTLAARRNVSIEAICGPEPEAEEFFEDLLQLSTEYRVEVSQMPADFEPPCGEASFVLMDAGSYRFQEKEETPAVACMNNPKLVEKLHYIFFKTQKKIRDSQGE